MSWLFAAAYAIAVGLLWSGVRFRIDPIVADGLRRMAPPPLRPPRGDRTWRAVIALAGVAIGVVAFPVAGAALAVAASAALGVAGYRFPDLLGMRRASAARAEASGRLPELLDLIAVSVGAGVSPRLALERSPEAIGGDIGGELGWARRRVSLGESWSTALEAVAERTRLPEIRRLAKALERSQRLGAPVGEQLRALARDVRAERAARQQERARRAPVAMLFPLVFLILPAFVLSAVVPAVLVAIGGVP